MNPLRVRLPVVGKNHLLTWDYMRDR